MTVCVTIPAHYSMHTPVAEYTLYDTLVLRGYFYTSQHGTSRGRNLRIKENSSCQQQPSHQETAVLTIKAQRIRAVFQNKLHHQGKVLYLIYLHLR